MLCYVGRDQRLHLPVSTLANIILDLRNLGGIVFSGFAFVCAVGEACRSRSLIRRFRWLQSVHALPGAQCRPDSNPALSDRR